jgi:hypothetical protein
MANDSSSRSPGAATRKRPGAPTPDWSSTPAVSPAAGGGQQRQATESQSPQRPSDLVEKAKETAHATGKALASQASDLAGHIGSELTETAEQQKGRGAEAMRGFARAVQGAANELDGQSPAVARYFRSAADSVESLSDTIRTRSVKDLVATATDTARTNPAAFFVGAVAAGFVLSRFLKSTSRSSTMDSASGDATPNRSVNPGQPPESRAAYAGASRVEVES